MANAGRHPGHVDWIFSVNIMDTRAASFCWRIKRVYPRQGWTGGSKHGHKNVERLRFIVCWNESQAIDVIKRAATYDLNLCYGQNIFVVRLRSTDGALKCLRTWCNLVTSPGALTPYPRFGDRCQVCSLPSDKIFQALCFHSIPSISSALNLSILR